MVFNITENNGKFFSNDSDKLRIPPHSVAAEQAILGGLMLDDSVWEKVADKLSVDDFYFENHRIVYLSMNDLVLENKPLDVITLSEKMESRNELKKIGGLFYLGQLAKNTPGSMNIIYYLEIVRKYSILRSLISVGRDIIEIGFDLDGRSAVDLLDEAEQKIFSISNRRKSSESGPVIISEILTKALDNVENFFKSGSNITGISSGFNEFDKLTSGLQSSDLIVIAGRPSMGKTTFAINIAEHVVLNTKKPVLIFSMEMTAEQLAMRIISSLGRIDLHKLRTGNLDDNDWKRLLSQLSLISSKKLFIDDTSSLSPIDIRARVRRIVREYGSLGIVVVDYLQLMKIPGSRDHRVAEISEISRSLKSLARELNVPIIALSQLNRSLEQRNDRRPIMSDLRESGSIEQDADLIVFVYRDEVYNKDKENKGIAEIIIGKQRNGPLGVVKLAFLGHYSRFENFTEEHSIPL